MGHLCLCETIENFEFDESLYDLENLFKETNNFCYSNALVTDFHFKYSPPKNEILSFTPPNVVANLHDLLSSTK